MRAVTSDMPVCTDRAMPMPVEISRGWAVSDGAAPAVQTGTTARTDLQPSPLEPTWILAGNPVARSLPLANAADGNLSFCLWDCTAGRFKFIHRRDEFVHILEGAVTVLAADRELHLRPGEVAFFPQGMTTYWTVYAYVKKLAILRSRPRGWLARIAGRAAGVWQRVLSAQQAIRRSAFSASG